MSYDRGNELIDLPLIGKTTEASDSELVLPKTTHATPLEEWEEAISDTLVSWENDIDTPLARLYESLGMPGNYPSAKVAMRAMSEVFDASGAPLPNDMEIHCIEGMMEMMETWEEAIEASRAAAKNYSLAEVEAIKASLDAEDDSQDRSKVEATLSDDGGVGTVSKRAEDVVQEHEKEEEEEEEEDDDEHKFLEKTRNKIRILFSLVQLISSIPFNLSVEFPAFYSNFLSFLGLIGFSFGWVPFGCLYASSHYEQLAFKTLASILFMAILLFCHIISRGKGQKTYFFLLLNFMYLILPICSSSAFSVFKCDYFDDNGASYMVADYNLICDLAGEKSGERVFWEVYAIVMMLIFPIGIPVTFMVLLYERRYDLCPKLKERGALYIFSRQDDWGEEVEWPEGSKERCAHLLFLVEMYEPHCFWFEVAESWRRLMLSSMLILLDDEGISQPVSAVLICLFSIRIFAYYEPYGDYDDDMLAEVSQWQVLALLFVVLLMRMGAFSDQDDDGALGVLLVVVTALGTGVMLLVLVVIYYNLTRVKEDPEGEIGGEGGEAQKEECSLEEIEDDNGDALDASGGDDDNEKLEMFVPIPEVGDSDSTSEGYSSDELVDIPSAASYQEVRRLTEAGCSAAQLKRRGFPAAQLKAAGFTVGQLKLARYSSAELEKAGFSAAELDESKPEIGVVENPSIGGEDGPSAQSYPVDERNKVVDLVANQSGESDDDASSSDGYSISSAWYSPGELDTQAESTEHHSILSDAMQHQHRAPLEEDDNSSEGYSIDEWDKI